MGAAFLAGLAIGFWKDPSELNRARQAGHKFYPKMPFYEREMLVKGWQKSVAKVISEF